jgi:hypothetical protein
MREKVTSSVVDYSQVAKATGRDIMAKLMFFIYYLITINMLHKLHVIRNVSAIFTVSKGVVPITAVRLQYFNLCVSIIVSV